MLVRIIKTWDYPDLMQQLPPDLATRPIRFTTEPVEKCDVAIVLNYLKEDLRLHCPPQNVWAIMQEPYIEGVFGWMKEKHEQYALVFTHTPPEQYAKYIPSFPALPWHVDKSYLELQHMAVPAKTSGVSWVTSNKHNFPGHKKRLDFLDFLRQQKELNLRLYGKGIRFIEDKWDALAPVSYAIAVENSTTSDYWTEKIADCFLSYTLPFYYGCENIQQYFPDEAFIRIDITRPEVALATMQQAIFNGEWEKRLPAIREARRRVLEKYNFFHFMAKKVQEFAVDQAPQSLHLRAYTPSLAQMTKKKLIDIKNKWYQSRSKH